MKNYLVLFVTILWLMPRMSNAQEIKKENLKNLDDKMNYTVGYDVGRSIQRNKLRLKERIFFKGLRDGMVDDESSDSGLLKDEERTEAKREHSKIQIENEKEDRSSVAAKNKKQADLFVKKNKKKRRVITTDSGLQYKIIKKGKGHKPSLEDKVTVHYKGSLIDGTEFDSSYKRNLPATFPVAKVIKGWTEALQLMTVGSKWILYIPPELGYGDRGAGATIKPNSLLIFEVELLEIVSEHNESQNFRQLVPNGVYKGKGYQNNGTSWSIEIHVDDDSVKIEYPSLSCGGTLSVQNMTDIHVEFQEEITHGSNCIDGGTTVLSILESGTDEGETVSPNVLNYSWLYANGEPGAVGQVTRHRLKRKL